MVEEWGLRYRIDSNLKEVNEDLKEHIKLQRDVQGSTMRFGTVRRRQLTQDKESVKLQKELKKAEKEAAQRAKERAKHVRKLTGVMAGLFAVMFKLGSYSPYVTAQMQIMDINMQRLGYQVGEAVAPLISEVNVALEDLVFWLDHLDPETKEATVLFFQLALVIGVLGVAIGVIAFIGAPAAAALGILLGAAAIFAVAWTKDILGIQDSVSTLLANFIELKDTLVAGFDLVAEGDIYAGLAKILAGMIGIVSTAINAIPALIFEMLGEAFMEVGRIVGDNVVGQIVYYIGTLLRGVGETLAHYGAGISMIIEGILTADLDLINQGVDRIFGTQGTSAPTTGEEFIEEHEGGEITPPFGGGPIIVNPFGATGAIIQKSGSMYVHKEEMLLNSGQQANLWNLANAGGQTNNNNQRELTINVNYTGDSYRSPIGNMELMGETLVDKLRSKGGF